MSPYLISGDVVSYDSSIKPFPGAIILFKHKDDLIIHRYISRDLYKGDNCKRFDQEKYPENNLNILGVVTERLSEGKGRPLHYGMRCRLLALTSQFNHASLIKIHRIFALMANRIGGSLRKSELYR